jgi:RNA polymerase sigma-70 factor (ECF subfamily)
MGDESAMAAVYDRYAGLVYGVALRVLRDEGAAEDTAQEVFMQLWRQPGLFDTRRGSLGPWLAVIARNRAIDAVRRRREQTEVPETIALNLDLEDEAARHLAVEKVRQVLAGVPQEQRTALEMAFFEGMTHTEIAQRTGQPLGTIKTRIRAALLALRRAFAP